MSNIVFLNGNYIPKEQASISIMDRGFLFGDGVYELIPVYSSKIFLLDKHLARLRSSLKHIGMDSQSTEIHDIENTINRIIRENDLQESFIYIQVTRGVQSPRNHVYQADIQPTVLIMHENYNIYPRDKIMQGFSATIQNDFRWTKANIKSISLLGNVLLKNYAHDNDCYESLLIRDDLVTEGAASNIFIVENGNVLTPKLSDKLLPGVTRDLIISLGEQNNRKVYEEDISTERLLNAEEIWCSSSTNYVVPITKVDDVLIQGGKVGNITGVFYNLVSDYINTL